MKGFSRVTEIKRADLERLLEHARPSLTEAEYQQLKAALDTLVYLTQLVGNKNTTIQRLRQILFGASSEKTAQVLKSLAGTGKSGEPAGTGEEPDSGAPAGGDGAPAPAGATPVTPTAKGHGRNGVADYPGAQTVIVHHPSLSAGDACPECRRGKLHDTTTPTQLIRVTGQAPLGATLYQLQKLRCSLCLEVYATEPPAGVGPEKYDAGAASMMALLKYGSGVPFYRLAGLQNSLGIPLPESTQWEIVDKTATLIKPAHEQLIREAAQGEVVYNDDTTVKIMSRIIAARKAREQAAVQGDAPASDDTTQQDESSRRDERTGLFTTSIVSEHPDHHIALYFSGSHHAGENLAQVLARRAEELAPPIQMCDALSRNVPKAFETVLSNCLAHARRKIVDVTPQFPRECAFVLTTLAQVYQHDAECKQRGDTPAARLAYHQAHSQPLMNDLQAWCQEQFAGRRVEPNSGLGEAITYLTRHWKELTLFLRKPGVPLDNNVCEQALKRAILHRKNSLYYRTDRGAQVGDLFMSLIHTCALVKANPFDYLNALQRHAAAVAEHPGQWMPWNYREAGLASASATAVTGQPDTS